MSTWKGVKAPASGLAVAAPKPGSKGRSASVLAQSPPPGAEVRVKPSEGVAGGLPDHGTSCVVVWLGPQIGGLLSGARGPSSKSIRKELNGTWGLSAKVVVSWPVSGSALTLPIRRAEIP